MLLTHEGKTEMTGFGTNETSYACAEDPLVASVLPTASKYDVLASLANYADLRKRVAVCEEELEAARGALYEAEQQVGATAVRLPDFVFGNNYSVRVGLVPYSFAVNITVQNEYSIHLTDPHPELPG